VSIGVSDSAQFVAVVTDSLGDTLQVVVHFNVIDTAVAVVDSNGSVVGVGAGVTKLAAWTTAGLSDTSIVQVSTPLPSRTISWKVPVDGDWTDPSKWDQGWVPTVDDSVAICAMGSSYEVVVHGA
jgi:hypothetical protein